MLGLPSLPATDCNNNMPDMADKHHVAVNAFGMEAGEVEFEEGDNKTQEKPPPARCEEVTPVTIESTCSSPPVRCGASAGVELVVELSRTAREMREILRLRKQRDPRTERRRDLGRRISLLEQL